MDLFKETKMAKDGIHQKYVVSRKDGRDKPGEKHFRCAYFVLDLTHDKFAEKALEAYAAYCRQECPDLARDLTAYLEYTQELKNWHCHCGARGDADCRCMPPCPPGWVMRLW